MLKGNKTEIFYKLILFTLVFLLPFGAKLIITELFHLNLTFFRFLLIVSMAALVINRDVIIPWKGELKLLTLFMGYLLIYGLISLLWVDDLHAAVQQVSHIIWGVLVVLVVFSLLNKVQFGLQIVFNAWKGVFFLLAIFGVIEVFGVVHFGGSFIEKLQLFDAFRQVFHAPLAAFTNPNDYAVFVLFSLVLFIVFYDKNSKLLTISAVLVSTFILYFIKSTLANYALYYLIASVFLYLMIRLLFHSNPPEQWLRLPVFRYKQERKSISALYVGVLAVVCLVFAIYSNALYINLDPDADKEHFVPLQKNSEGLRKIALRAKDATWTGEVESISPFQSESFGIRRGLIVNGWCMAKQSFFLGQGAGQFVYLLNNKDMCVDLALKTNPHSFVIEILSQFGIVPVLLFGLFVLFLLIIAIKTSSRNISNGITPESWFVFLMVPVYLLLSNAPSSFIPHAMNWIVLALLAFVSQRITDDQIDQHANR